jgi:hypothetical protein
MGPDEAKKYGGNGLDAGARMYADNNNWFKGKYGNAPTPGQLYMVAQQGRGGIDAHMANPDAPAWQNMYSTAEGQQKGANWAKKAIWGNVPTDMRSQFPNGVDGLTSGQFMDLWDHKVAHTPMSQAMSSGAPKMADPQADQGSLSGKFMAGGPGALFGAPNGVFPAADGTPGGGYDLGGALQGAAASLAAIYNPAGSAAMMNAMNAPLFRQRYSVSFDKRGFPIVFDVHTGKSHVLQTQGGPAGGGVSGDPYAVGQSPNALDAADKALAESSNKEYEGSQAADLAAKNSLDLVNQARELVNAPGVHQGASGELFNEGKKVLKTYTGYDAGGTDQGDMLDKLAGQIAANQAKAMGVTRYAGPEIKMAQSATLNLDRTKEANLQTLANMEHLAQQTIAQHKARTEYMKRNNGVLGPGFQKYLDQATAQNPAYQVNPAMMAPGAGGQRPPLSSFQQ